MTYIQQAFKGQNESWRFIITAFLTSLIFIVNFVFLIFFGDGLDVVEEQKKLYEMIPSHNFWLAVNLSIFVVLILLLFGLVKFLHQRNLLSLTTSRSKIDWSRILFSFSLIVIITLISFGVSYYADSSQIEMQFNPLKFGLLVLVSLVLFPFQIGFEEYFFRGYLIQQIGVMVRNRWFPLILTSLVFGVAHSANPEVTEMGYITMVFYIGTGLLLGIMTLMDEGLELALGFHLGNNLLAALLITSDWSALQTDAIFKYTAEEANTTAMEILVPVLIFYPIILLILGKKYKWSNWGQKLFGKVKEPLAENYKIIE